MEELTRQTLGWKAFNVSLGGWVVAFRATAAPTASLALSYHARGERLLVESRCRLGWFWIGGLVGKAPG